MREKLAKVLVNGGWTGASEVFGLAVRFVSVPLLLASYGREDYGLIAIVTSVQIYLGILSLGTPDGLVKYAAEWIHHRNTRALHLCARTVFTFYSGLGLLSAIILAILGLSCAGLFHISELQKPILQNMFILTGASALLLSPMQLMTQLLKAAEEFHFLSKCAIVRSLLEMVLVLGATGWQVRLDYFLALRLLIPILTMPALIWKWSRHGSVRAVLGFGWHWTAFRPVMNYGCAILAMGWCYTTFFQLRQVILGVRSTTTAVAEFSIILAMTNVLTMAGGWIVGPLVPSMAKALAGGEDDYVQFVAYRMTKYFGLLLTFPAVYVMVNADSLLSLYVGRHFTGLGPCVALMMLCILDTFMAPLSGIIFAKGKLRPFVWSNGILGATALAVVWLLAPGWGSRAAVAATLTYYGTNILFHLVYYIPRIMNLDSWRLLREGYAGPVIVGATTAGIMMGFRSLIAGTNDWARLGLTLGVGVICYPLLVWIVAIGTAERALVLKSVVRLRNWIRIAPAVVNEP